MVDATNFKEWEVRNTEQAVRLVKEQFSRIAQRHALAFVIVPDPNEVTRKDQRKQYTLLMMEYGIAVGLIEMAHKAGFLEDAAYKELKNEAATFTMPGVVGIV